MLAVKWFFICVGGPSLSVRIALCAVADVRFKRFRFGAQTQTGSHPLPNATDESVSKGVKLFSNAVFEGVVVPRRLNLKDDYDGGLVVHDHDFGSGQWAPPGAAVAHEAGNPLSNINGAYSSGTTLVAVACPQPPATFSLT